MATKKRERRLGRRRNDDGVDLVFLGNNQPWSDAFVGEGVLGDFYDDGNLDDGEMRRRAHGVLKLATVG